MDFLTRLVQRQHTEQIGVRPVLPSRFETEAGAPSLTETSEPAPAITSPRTMHVAPKHDPPAPRQDSGPGRASVPRREHGHQPARLPQPLLPEPDLRPTAQSREIPLRDISREPSTTDSAPHKAKSRGVDVPQPIRGLVRSALPMTAERVATPALPAPMLEPSAQPFTPAPTLTERLAPEPTTVTISIGRVELRAPSAPPAAPSPSPLAQLARPSFRPRLTLEDYLAQPNRGRR